MVRPARSASVAPRWVRSADSASGSESACIVAPIPQPLPGEHQRASGGAAPDVDRQVVAHLVDEQVAGAGGDLVEPVVLLPPAADEDAGRIVGEEVDERADRSVVLPACGASELSITPRRRSTTAHSVAIRRASIAGVPISSTALIGVGGSQW